MRACVRYLLLLKPLCFTSLEYFEFRWSMWFLTVGIEFYCSCCFAVIFVLLTSSVVAVSSAVEFFILAAIDNNWRAALRLRHQFKHLFTSLLRTRGIFSRINARYCTFCYVWRYRCWALWIKLKATTVAVGTATDTPR
jgi:hypothetical protein